MIREVETPAVGTRVNVRCFGGTYTGEVVTRWLSQVRVKFHGANGAEYVRVVPWFAEFQPGRAAKQAWPIRQEN